MVPQCFSTTIYWAIVNPNPLTFPDSPMRLSEFESDLDRPQFYYGNFTIDRPVPDSILLMHQLHLQKYSQTPD
jgi:hypothetical protein